MSNISKQIINFSVDKVELLENVKRSRFQKAKIYAFADGANTNTLDIENDVLIKCANTIYDIPILYKYNKYINDFEGHEPDEIPCGFIKEEESNPVNFSKAPDGRTFITIIGTIWKKYSADVLRVFNQDGNKKSVSVEMEVTDSDIIDDELKVNEFVLDGITILGDFINPAVKGANIQLEFSEDKKEYLNQLKFESDAKSHILQHYEELGLEIKNFCMSNRESVGVETLNKDLEFEDKDKKEDKKIEEEKPEDKKNEDKKEEMSEGKPEDKKEEEKPEDKKNEDKKEEMSEEKPKEDEPKPEDKKEDMSEKPDKKEEEKPEVKKEEMSIEAKCEAMSVEMSRLQDENKAYMAKIAEMSDYEDLKKFKADTESEKQKEAEMSKINEVMSEIEKRGVSMSEKEKKDLTDKFKEFSSVDAWSNYAKAQVFDRVENIDGITKIGLPFETPKKTSIWDNL